MEAKSRGDFDWEQTLSGLKVIPPQMFISCKEEKQIVIIEGETEQHLNQMIKIKVTERDR